jgi:hypothetical protein
MVGVSGRASLVLIVLSAVVACHATKGVWISWPKNRQTREPSPAQSLVRLLTDTPLNFDAINNSLRGLCQALRYQILYQARKDPFWFSDHAICRLYGVGEIILSRCDGISYQIESLKIYLATDQSIFESYISACERQWKRICSPNHEKVLKWWNKLRNNLDLIFGKQEISNEEVDSSNFWFALHC